MTRMKLSSVRLQTALVVTLFLGSLATVLFNTFRTLHLSGREQQVQDQLREASRRLADAAKPQIGVLAGEGGQSFGDLNSKLRAISDRILREFPGVEGGFYLSAGIDRF